MRLATLAFGPLLLGVCPSVSADALAKSPKPATASYADVQLAWGVLTGAMHQIFANQEACSKQYPEIKPMVSAAFEKWKARNSYMDEVKSAVYKKAREQGGDREALRLSQEITDAYKTQEPRVRAYAEGLNQDQCIQFAKKLDGQAYDLKIRYPSHMKAILGWVP